MNSRFLNSLLLFASATQSAAAAGIAIQNAGFEDPYLTGNLPAIHNGVVPATAFPTGGPPAGWQSYDPDNVIGNGAFVGVLNPGTVFFSAGAAEGSQAALLYVDGDSGGAAYGISQTLGDTLQANTHYALTVQVGNIASGASTVQPYQGFGFYNLDGFPGYSVQLLAGGVVIAEDHDSLSPAEGQWQQSLVELTTGAAHAQLGTALEIRLLNLNNPDVPGVRGLEVDFDDVTLDATVAAVPIPAPGIWLLSAALAMLLLERRRR